MRRRIAAAAFVVLSGCVAPTTADWIDPAECGTNTPPAVGQIAVASQWNTETQLFEGCVSVNWVDPGLDAAGNQGTDAPNMFGGLFSAEFTAASVPGVWLNEDYAIQGQTDGTVETPICSDDWGPSDQLVQNYPHEDDLDQGNPNEWPPDYSGCTDWDEDGTLEREDCFAGAVISFAVRVRDRCDATSNVITGDFRLGSPRQVSEEGLTGCSVIPPCPGSEEP